MCIPLNLVLTLLYIVIIEIYLQCFTDSVILRDIGKPTSRAEISSPSSSYFKAVKGAHIGSALTGAASELTNSNRKKNLHKTPFSENTTSLHETPQVYRLSGLHFLLKDIFCYLIDS